MKQRIQFTFHRFGVEETYHGEFTFGISPEGRVAVDIVKLSINEGDFREIAWVVQKLLTQKVVRELSQDLNAFRYASIVDVSEIREEDVPDEKVVRELS